MITIRPHHDTCTLKPRPDLHALLHNIMPEGGHVMSKLFGKVRIDSPISYKITGKLNQFAFAEVLRMGKGSCTGQGRDVPALEQGAIVGVDLGQVGHVLPTGEYHTSWRNLLCVFREHHELPWPLMNRVMVEHDDALVDRFIFRGAPLRAPKLSGDDIKTNDRARTKVGLTVSRVVAHGPGRYVKKLLEDIDVSAGEVVAYTPSNGSVDFMFSRGRLLRFVPWSEIDFSVEGLDG